MGSVRSRTFLNRLAVGLLCALVALVISASPTPPAAARESRDSDSAIQARANALMMQMTPSEKAGQLTQLFYFGPPSESTLDAQVTHGGVGSLLMISDPAVANRFQHQAVEQSRLHIPLLFGFDVIHGLHTIFPVPIGMAASFDPAMVEDAQSIAAKESRASGIHWTFAPMVDIARDPRWGRIVEGAGEDPYLGSAMAAAQVRGFQGAYLGSPDHLTAGPKHFAGYGASMGGRDYDEVDLSDSQLWNVYLPPFKAAIDAGAGNIMSAYMGLNGVPGAANGWLLTDVLRNAWGFRGFVVTDANAVQALVTHGVARNSQDAAARAVRAGVDMEMAMPVGDGAAFHALPAAVEAGQVTQARIDDAVRRVLAVKIRMGLFEHPYVDEARSARVINDPAHAVTARIAAERSAVLLKNEGGLLPIDRARLRSIAVIGPLADSPRDTLGPWVLSRAGQAPAVSILAGIRAKVGPNVRVDYSEGVRMPERANPSPFAHSDPRPQRAPLDQTAEIQRAVGLARNADVAIVVLGEAWEMIGEMASRDTFDLPGRQQELLDAIVATGKPVVVMLMSGRPLDLKDTHAGAVMELWYPGSQGGAAAANLLFGDANPAGRLPFTWARSAGQEPLFYGRLNSQSPADADKRYWGGSNTPTYPFGYGLSYSTFSYAHLRVEHDRVAPGAIVNVAVDVTNNSSRAGDEVAQLYIHQRSGTSARPVRELKGFQRVTLSPHETRTLRFTLGPNDLRYWSSATHDWIADESAFDVWVGGSSAARLSASFDVAR